nr:immunoglobulin light chain junction region [Macaca mulatta]
CQQDDNFPF